MIMVMIVMIVMVAKIQMVTYYLHDLGLNQGYDDDDGDDGDDVVLPPSSRSEPGQ